jgi:outer membrane lipoprotein SlyB
VRLRNIFKTVLSWPGGYPADEIDVQNKSDFGLVGGLAGSTVCGIGGPFLAAAGAVIGYKAGQTIWHIAFRRRNTHDNSIR